MSVTFASGELPLGMTPDDNLGPLTLRTLWTLLGISTVFIFARLVVKCRTTRRIYWDDFLMVLALGFGYAHAVSISVAVSTGFGRHFIYLSPEERKDTVRVGFYSLAWGFLSPLAGRLGFMVFLLFVAGIDPLIKKWWLYIFMFLQVVINLSAIIVLYTQCGSELDILWDPTKQAEFNTKCSNPIIQSDYGYFQGSFNTLTDIFLTIMPALIIWHTKLKLKAKLALACLLCLSILAMIASVVKTYEARALSEVLDYTFDLVIYVIWISIELNVVIIVATIPLLRPLFRRDMFPFGRRQPHQQGTVLSSMTSLPRKGWENITLDSVLSKKDKTKSQTSELGVSTSSEDILESREHQNPYGITRTVEVQITYETNDKPHVHAALVGLCPGIIEPHRHAGHAA